jgi:heme/copper-type cytochrome/quinol oxidase subunit 2
MANTGIANVGGAGGSTLTKEIPMPLAFLTTLTILAVVTALIIAALTGAVTAFLARADGATAPGALIRAGVAFGATLTLIAVLVTTVAGLLG